MRRRKRIDAAEVGALAQNRWHEILTTLGVSDEFLSKGRTKQGPCPQCGGKTHFRFDDKNGRGTFYCETAGAGDGFKLLMHAFGWSFGQALRAVAKTVGYVPGSVPETPIRRIETREPPSDWRQYKRILSLWESGHPIISGDPAWLYLTKTRGLELPSIPDCLRYVPEVWTKEDDWTEKRCFPAMVAKLTDPDGQIVQVHRTFLTPEGQKAAMEKPKKLMTGWKDGATAGGSIKLFQPGEVLGLAEGIETALACHILYGLPVWSCYSAVLLQQVHIPAGVREVVIFADNDPAEKKQTGQRAALALKKRLAAEGLAVKTLVPTGVKDFADLLIQKSRTA